MLNTLIRYGYAGIDESSKVRCLNAGIKTDKLNAPKAQIMSSRALQDNFTSMTLSAYTKTLSPNPNQPMTTVSSMSEASMEEAVAKGEGTVNTKEAEAVEEAEEAEVEEADEDEGIASESTKAVVEEATSKIDTTRRPNMLN